MTDQHGRGASETSAGAAGPAGPGRPVRAGDDIDLRAVVKTVWAGRWLIGIVMVIALIAGAAYAYFATPWYKADIVLSPVVKKTSLSSGLAQLGGLASLAGIDVPSANTGEPVAVLKSKILVEEFITDNDLLTQLLSEEWDPATHDWKEKAGDRRPDLRDGVKYFDERVRTVVDDKKTGLVTLSIRWKDPRQAADWGNQLVRRVNDRLRSEAIRESESSIQYLQKELIGTTVFSLQQSIGRVLESEMQKMALARSKEEFAFKVIDPAKAPKRPVWPRRLVVLVLAGFLGLILGAVIVLVRAPAGRLGRSG